MPLLFKIGDRVRYWQNGTEWYATIIDGPLLVGNARPTGPSTLGWKIHVTENTRKDRAGHQPFHARYRFRKVAERNLQPDEGE